ncbi:MAG: hypothetical protein WCC39_08750, partial [Telluria sp.]
LVHEDAPGEIEEGTAELRKRIAGINAHWGEQADKFSRMAPDERDRAFRTAFNNYVPYAIFFMMPLFALYLKVLYLGSGRRFGEHLLFALHSNGFAFLMLALMLLVPTGWGLVKWMLGLWLAFYLPTAMRRVYGGSRKATALRWIVLMFLHLVTLVTAIASTVGVGVFH